MGCMRLFLYVEFFFDAIFGLMFHSISICFPIFLHAFYSFHPFATVVYFINNVYLCYLMLHLKSFKINAQTLRNGTAKQSTKQNSIYAPNSFFRYAPCFSLQSVHFLFFPLLDAIKYESFDVKLKFV